MAENDAHRTFTTERGSFCLARCDCGWTGMARRARSQARADAERHLAGVGVAGSDAASGPAAERPVE
ncbi:hypothetical protein ADL22_29015 [Streptomyces sp. NRRL F-4489]|uniref:hypothetical protein n=1 Tax=Streptomyces sp. NRRL F-4489 TaxID=1609095 RepID=UPI000747AD88|nr:hypothetical protein [Streptomyces sp. NRRL F-4489]KUL34941.1 hypothetical protein ADL22_29015 [Streptomyces sp. NRRL F-4489]